MQDQCAIDFDYMKHIGVDCAEVEGVKQLSLNGFVSSGWINDETDSLWLDNYLKNKTTGAHRFPLTRTGVGKCVVLVGSSPAILKQIDTLKQIGTDFIIVACNAVYKKLVSEKVRVDYVFAVEAGHHIHKDFTIQNESTVLIASPFICPSVLTMWEGKRYFYYIGGGSRYHAELEKDGIDDIDIGGGNVISTAMLWAYKYLQARDFIFIGTTFGYYDQYYYDGRTTKTVGGFESNIPIYAVDMYGAVINTTAPLMMYKTWLETYTRYLKGSTFSNCTEDGSFGTVPEVIENKGGDIKYKIRHVPWINILPFTMAVEIYEKKFKEIKNGTR